MAAMNSSSSCPPHHSPSCSQVYIEAVQDEDDDIYNPKPQPQWFTVEGEYNLEYTDDEDDQEDDDDDSCCIIEADNMERSTDQQQQQEHVQLQQPFSNGMDTNEPELIELDDAIYSDTGKDDKQAFDDNRDEKQAFDDIRDEKQAFDDIRDEKQAFDDDKDDCSDNETEVIQSLLDHLIDQVANDPSPNLSSSPLPSMKTPQSNMELECVSNLESYLQSVEDHQHVYHLDQRIVDSVDESDDECVILDPQITKAHHTNITEQQSINNTRPKTTTSYYANLLKNFRNRQLGLVPKIPVDLPSTSNQWTHLGPIFTTSSCNRLAHAVPLRVTSTDNESDTNKRVKRANKRKSLESPPLFIIDKKGNRGLETVTTLESDDECIIIDEQARRKTPDISSRPAIDSQTSSGDFLIPQSLYEFKRQEGEQICSSLYHKFDEQDRPPRNWSHRSPPNWNTSSVKTRYDNTFHLKPMKFVPEFTRIEPINDSNFSELRRIDLQREHSMVDPYSGFPSSRHLGQYRNGLRLPNCEQMLEISSNEELRLLERPLNKRKRQSESPPLFIEVGVRRSQKPFFCRNVGIMQEPRRFKPR